MTEPTPPSPSSSSAPSPRRRALRLLERICLVLPLLVTPALALLGVQPLNVVSLVICAVCLVPFFLDFEFSRIRARDLMPIVVLSALAVAGRLIFAPLPAIKPVIAIVIIAGMSFGRQTGFLTGALGILVSNMFFGQGPWTPMQMYSMGVVGWVSAVLGEKGVLRPNWLIYVYGFLASYFYGGVLDSWSFLAMVQPWSAETAIATFGGGAFFNLGSAIGTVLFLLPIAVQWPPKFERVKQRYGIGLRS